MVDVGIGMVVERIQAGSPLEGSVVPGDRLIAADGEEVREVAFQSLRQRLRGLSGRAASGETISFVFERTDATKHVVNVNRSPFGVFLKVTQRRA